MMTSAGIPGQVTTSAFPSSRPSVILIRAEKYGIPVCASVNLSAET